MTAVSDAPTGTRVPQPRPRIGTQVARVLTTTDHKLIGKLYLGTAFAWFLVGGVMALLIRSELAFPGQQVINDELYKQRDEIVVLTTNDTHVLRAWAEQSGGKGKVRFVSDGNLDFIEPAGLSFDGSGTGMGRRARRFAMIVEDGVVTALAVEEQAGQTAVSTAAQILEKL